MSSGSSLSSSGSSASSSPAPTRKKRHIEVESSDSSDDQDTSNASSINDLEEDLDAPQPLPSTEVTVLSHAERRRQKKKQKQQLITTSTSESPRKKRKLDDGEDVSSPNIGVKAKAKTMTPTTKGRGSSAVDDPRRRQKRQNSIWVGNLSFRTTRDALRKFFEGVGTITRVHMPMQRGNEKQGENMGFAYVDFETPGAKVIAITLSEGQLDGRNLLIKDGDDFTGRPVKAKTEPSKATSGGEDEKVVKNVSATGRKPLSKTAQKILHAQKQPPAPTLFLGNLGFETTEDSIRELFEVHRYQGDKDKGNGNGADIRAEKQEVNEGEGQGGESKDVWIRKVRMGTFEDSGTCKGFAFVDFTSIEHATEALVNPRNHRLKGRDLVVEYASPDAVRRGGGPRHPKGDRGQKSRNGGRKVPQNGPATASYNKRRQPWHVEQDDDVNTAEIPAEATTVLRSRRPERTGRDRPQARRAKPGATLAHAQRQSAAILPSQAQKIVF